MPCLALRVTYVRRARPGRLYCPERVPGLAALGRDLGRGDRSSGLLAGGYRAIDSLRLEKSYRVWGSDITPDDTPVRRSRGLGFAVKLDKGDFLGRDALLRAPRKPERTPLLRLLLADPRAVALGSEPVRLEGAAVGRVTSGGYGYSVERSIAYAYLPSEWAHPGQPVEVEIFGEWVAGEVAAEPLFDPSGARIRS